MQCDYCDSKATVFFTQIIDGVSKKSCLCEKCASDQGVTDPDGFLLGSMDIEPAGKSASKDHAKQPDSATPPTKAEEHTICPGCGFAFDDLKKTGRLGCSQCYQFFRTEIKHNLGGMHKGTHHTGRIPEGMIETYQKRQQLESLQQELNTAINAEDYEKAATLRDQITQLSQDNSLTPDA